MGSGPMVAVDADQLLPMSVKSLRGLLTIAPGLIRRSNLDIARRWCAPARKSTHAREQAVPTGTQVQLCVGKPNQSRLKIQPALPCLR